MSLEVSVVEAFVEGKCSDYESEDFLVMGPRFVGVVDGSSQKSWSRGPTGRSVAAAVREVLERINDGIPFVRVVDLLTEETAGLFGQEPPARATRSCATLAVFDVRESCVWRLGDPSVLFDGVLVKERSESELAVASKRAHIIRDAIAEGATVDSIRAVDVGRRAIEEDLRVLATSRNSSERDTFGAIDGLTVPDVLIECFRPGGFPTEVVIASDGYPEPRSNLVESERLLTTRLARDPLMIEDPPQTKGVSPGCASFDDRSYVRLKVGT